MTGSGTQESPYIVTTWAEFLSVCNISTSTYVEWNNAEVDFNEIQPSGFTDSIEIKSNIRLYKVKWRNFVSRAKIALKIMERATKIDLEEFEFVNAQLFHPASNNSYDGAVFSSGGTTVRGVYTIKNCVFSYRQDSAGKGGFIKYISGSSKATGTALMIKSNCTGEYAFESGSGILSYSECNIKLDIQAGSLAGPLRAFLCWYSGKIQTSAASWSDSTNNLLGNIVFDVECSATISLNTYQYRCVYNSDKCTVTGTNWIGATTAQLSDTNYLYNQGLPVARDSS
jgi:hypothetical protein